VLLCISWLCRAGFIFILGIDGLQTFGRERPMVKAASIQRLVMYFLAISKMDGDMATSFVLMLMEQGLYSIHYGTLFNFSQSSITLIWHVTQNNYSIICSHFLA